MWNKIGKGIHTQDSLTERHSIWK